MLKCFQEFQGYSKGYHATVLAFFYSVIWGNIQNAQDLFESLVNIVGPVRQAMHLNCQSMDANIKFDKASQI